MKLSLSSSRRRPPSPALLTLAAAVRTQFRLCWRGKCVGRSSIERPCWNCRGPRGAVSRMLEEERITEQASDVVEDPWGVAETVAENFNVSTLAVGVRLKAIGLISDADSEGVRVEVIGSGNLGGKNGRRRKESRLLGGSVSETRTSSLNSWTRNARRRDARGQKRGTRGQHRDARSRRRK